MTQSPDAAPTFPAGRYGRRRDPARLRGRRGRRWITAVLAAAVALVGVAIAVKLYRQYAEAPFQVRIISVTDLTDTAVTVTFEVRTPPGDGASCTILAHTRDGEEVGNAVVVVPPGGSGQTSTRFTYTLRTSKRPVTGEVPGCGPLPQPTP